MGQRNELAQFGARMRFLMYFDKMCFIDMRVKLGCCQTDMTK
jgi:hypothetical protein